MFLYGNFSLPEKQVGEFPVLPSRASRQFHVVFVRICVCIQLGSLTQTSCEGKIKFPASPTGLSERDQDRGVFSSQLRRRNLSQQVGRDGIREEAVRLLIVGWCVPRNCGESGGRWEGYIRGLRSHTGVTQQPDTHPPGDVAGDPAAQHRKERQLQFAQERVHSVSRMSWALLTRCMGGTGGSRLARVARRRMRVKT